MEEYNKSIQTYFHEEIQLKEDLSVFRVDNSCAKCNIGLINKRMELKDNANNEDFYFFNPIKTSISLTDIFETS
jgi:hypothetical protein